MSLVHQVRNLSGSLSLVTCKEPLRVSMCNQLRNMLQQQMQSTGHLSADQQHLIEQAVQAKTQLSARALSVMRCAASRALPSRATLCAGRLQR